jgi:DNA-binding NtrC family response regulator
LVESELFGVKRGAFSDAKEDRPGLIRSAHHGTLFLDEIGDLKLAIQTAFLRVLQESEVVPLGQSHAVPVDVRLVSASHRDLATLVATDRFREDLVVRLSGFTIRIPPLRDRREDLGILVAHLVRKLALDATSVRFHADAIRRLLDHRWPGNVRELEKRLGAALVLAGSGAVQVAHLGEFSASDVANRAAARESDATLAHRAELERLLSEHRGNLAAVARALGKDRVQVRRWLRRYGIDLSPFRG